MLKSPYQMNGILNYELLSNSLSNSENFQRGKMRPSSTTSSVTATACCRNTLCNLLQSASFTACMGQGSGPAHAYPIFPGVMGCWFCVGRMQSCYAAILRAPCMKGNAYHTEVAVEQRAVTYPMCELQTFSSLS